MQASAITKALSKGTEQCETFKPMADEISAFGASLTKLGNVYVRLQCRWHIAPVPAWWASKVKMPRVCGLFVAKKLQAFSKVLDPQAPKKRP